MPSCFEKISPAPAFLEKTDLDSVFISRAIAQMGWNCRRQSTAFPEVGILRGFLPARRTSLQCRPSSSPGNVCSRENIFFLKKKESSRPVKLKLKLKDNLSFYHFQFGDIILADVCVPY